MSVWQRAPLFFAASLGGLFFLVLFIVVIALRGKEPLTAPVVLDAMPKEKLQFPADFGRLDALVPYAGGVAPIAAQVATVEHVSEFRDAAWVKAQSADAYTLQVLAVRDEEAVKRFLAAQSDRSRFVYFRTTLEGVEWYVVTSGSYGTAELARSVAEAGSFGADTKPFPRRMGAYQTELPAKPVVVPPAAEPDVDSGLN